ncbi:MAG: 50S ribosomal protein L3 [Candidatus Omnitrophica bacterium]|nr:50S ribosomal protein L3 [Candidatus Omnitrophota bacterium]MBI5145359.1 50S ribosomal protein L3 [Candidatus Omnitrophota bacterium]
MAAILGKKIGMTHIFSEDAKLIGVTVLQAGPCPVLNIGGQSIQLGFDSQREKSLKKPQAGYFKKIKVAPCRLIQEVPKEEGREYTIGQELKADLFKSGDFVDITGTSIGKGFQGGMKRWHWSGGSRTHGSTSHRRIGSIGSSTTPGRVWKGHHLPGHMGAARVTTQNLKVVKVDLDNNLLLVKGSVPGKKNNYLVIKNAKKKQRKENRK